MIKALIFDLDDTLYAYWPAHNAAFRAVTEYAEHELGIPASDFAQLHREADRRLRAHAGDNCAAVHNRLIRYQLLLEARELPIRHAPLMAERYWSVFFSAVRPEEGTAEALDRLRALGCRIGVGTNMTAQQQFTKLELLGLLDRVDFLVSSEEVSAEKPDAPLFACCVRKAGCAPEECLFVGDSLEGDVLGAQRAGLVPVLLDRAREERSLPEGLLRIRAVSELPALLEKLREKE